jgi:hypothetical protein
MAALRVAYKSSVPRCVLRVGKVMDLHFSEFSFGYAVTQEYVGSYAAPLKAASVFHRFKTRARKGMTLSCSGSDCAPIRLVFRCFHSSNCLNESYDNASPRLKGDTTSRRFIACICERNDLTKTGCLLNFEDAETGIDIK